MKTNKPLMNKKPLQETANKIPRAPQRVSPGIYRDAQGTLQRGSGMPQETAIKTPTAAPSWFDGITSQAPGWQNSISSATPAQKGFGIDPGFNRPPTGGGVSAMNDPRFQDPASYGKSPVTGGYGGQLQRPASMMQETAGKVPMGLETLQRQPGINPQMMNYFSSLLGSGQGRGR